ncbi:MAG: nuclear transport factor 2 family protein [Methanocalculaceae archaeon]|jgi:ketosteroid isomerase-like protein|nr:nuclear transport factor 2 family protein [Methanocalculaceae archaeon]
MPLSAQTKTQITNLLLAYQTAYNRHDPEALAKNLATDIIMYGCRTGEFISGRENFITMVTKNISRYKIDGILLGEPEIKGDGIVAWISAECILLSTSGSGAVHETPSRFTAVLRGTGHAWEFVQIHMSLGYPYHE